MIEGRTSTLQDFIGALENAFSTLEKLGARDIDFLAKLFAALNSTAPRGKSAATLFAMTPDPRS